MYMYKSKYPIEGKADKFCEGQVHILNVYICITASTHRLVYLISPIQGT